MKRKLKYDVIGIGSKGDAAFASTPYYENNGIYVTMTVNDIPNKIHLVSFMEITTVNNEAIETDWSLLEKLYADWHENIGVMRVDLDSCRREWKKMDEASQKKAYDNFKSFQAEAMKQYGDKKYVKKLYKYLKEKDYEQKITVKQNVFRG